MDDVLHIVWFRNDLRIKFNRILEELCFKNISFLPLFILDPKILNSEQTSQFRKEFLYECLIDLDSQLKELGSMLVLAYSNPILFFKEILKKHKQVQLHHSKDYTNFAINRDKEIKILFENYGQKVINYKNISIVDDTDNLLNNFNQPFKVFTHFKNALRNKLHENPNLLYFKKYEIKPLNKQVINEKLRDISNLIEITEVQKLLSSPQKIIIPGGEKAAQKLWSSFKEKKIKEYHINRNFFDIDGTSKLSPHLKFGTISPIQITIELLNQTDNGSQAFLNEILWREFYKYINIYFSYAENNNFNRLFDNFEWTENKHLYQKWCLGETGIPIIDANMRCLNQTGWMHNRGRMIVASFLCKNLGIHWKEGEVYFKKKLIDWDKTSNNGGWQWTAGTGTDAAPYFRIFNPILQSKKFDPDGIFIKTYIKELKHVPKEYIHEPYKMPEFLQKKCKCIIGKDYPSPIIDLELTRKIALEKYAKIKLKYKQ